MSFILDALRKSEHERQRGALPGVAQIPYALPHARLPLWVPAAIGALAVALAVMASAWWYTARPARAGGERMTASAAAPQAAAAAVAPAPKRTVDSGPQEAARVASAAQPAASAPSAAEREPVATAATAATATTAATAALPTASALAAAGVVPPLLLQLIVYDDDAAKRWVMINGQRYSEGALLSEGPELVQIANRSVVLRLQGRDFRLLTE